MTDFKKFTKAQFNAMTNEIVRLAREFNENGFDSSVTFLKETLTLYIHDEHSCVCVLTLRRSRYVCCKEFKELEDIAKRANISLDRHYVGMMRDSIINADNDNYYVEF